ncbi:MAG: hypothetical protein H6813_03635 [Phycisphaeraceae bacterium]|nr:hypothetical protein [Phycisphaeraceae bacterium]
MNSLSRLVVVVLMVVVGGAPASAQYGTEYDPRDFESPSGRYRMHVEPTDRYGFEPCVVSVFVDGKRMWERTVEPSIWIGGVTDEGRAFGVGYVLEHTDERRPAILGEVSRMRILSFDDAGQTTLIAEKECRRPRGVFTCGGNNPGYPFAQRLSVQPGADRVVISAYYGYNAEHPQVWWLYRLSDGADMGMSEPITSFSTANHVNHNERQTDAIPNTPLILAQWSKSARQGDGRKHTTVIGVCTTDGVIHWQREFEAPDDGGDQWRDDRLESRPGIVFRPGGFTVTTPDGRETTTYLCAPDRSAGGWGVVALDARTVEPVLQTGVSFEPGPATILGAITLDSFVEEKPAIWAITDLDIDRDGVIGFIRRDENNEPHLTRATMEGEILSDRALGELLGKHPQHIASMPGGRWLITGDGFSNGEFVPFVLIFDQRDGSLAAPLGWAGGALREPVALPDGGFLGLVGEDMFRADHLASFDRFGRERWRVECFTPEDVVIDRSGRLCVLEKISHRLRYFSTDGKELRVVDLDRAIGEELQYPTMLVPTIDGGVICFDYPSDEPFIRIDKDGAYAGRFRPAHPDGWSCVFYTPVRPTSDGSFWTSDHLSLIRMDSDGVWDRVLGDAPWAAPLRVIDDIALGPGDTPHVINARTHAVHVFDALGHERRLLAPAPSRFTTGYCSGSVTVAGDGAVCVSEDEYPNRRSQWFDGSGSRLAASAEELELQTGQWRYIPGTNERWQVAGRSLRRFDADGEVAVTIERTADGDWFGYISGFAVAADGSVVVRSSQRSRERDQTVLSVYRRDGSPVGVVDHDFDGGFIGSMAYAPPVVVFSNGDRLRFVHETGERAPIEQRLPAGITDDMMNAYTNVLIPERDGEVWIWTANSPTITRVAMPE